MQKNELIDEPYTTKWQCRWSPTLGSLEEDHQKIWGTTDYKYKDIPTVFMGCYSYADFLAIWTHSGRKAILWCGGDILRITGPGYWLHNSPVMTLQSDKIAEWINENCENYCENIWEYDELKKIGIESKIVPSFLGDVNNYQVTFKPGNKVYASVSGDNFEQYGWHKIEAIAKLNKDIDFYLYGNEKEWKSNNKNVYVRGKVDKRIMNEEIKHMQAGIRLLSEDGFSEILAKSVLWGQYPIAEIEYPYMLRPYHLRMILDKKEPNIEGRDYYLRHLNQFPWNKNKE